MTAITHGNKTSKSNKRQGVKIGKLNIVAAAIWIALFIKIFIFDLESYIINSFIPNLAFILPFKLFIYAGLLYLLWRRVGGLNLLLSTIYTMVFPIILITWIIPNFLYRKGWFWILFYVNSLFNYLKNLRINLLYTSLTGMGVTLILFANQNYLIGSGIIFLIALLMIHYYGRFMSSFRPISIFSISTNTIINLVDSEKFSENVSKILAPTPDTSHEQRNQDTAKDDNNDQTSAQRHLKLQSLLIVNRALLYAVKYLEKFKSNHLLLFFYGANLISTFFLTLAVFSLASYGLFRIDASHFKVEDAASLPMFLYYGLFGVLGNPIDEIKAASAVSRVMLSSFTVTNYILFAMMLITLLSSRTENHKNNLNDLSASIKKQCAQLESEIADEYSLDISGAIQLISEKDGIYKTYIIRLSELL